MKPSHLVSICCSFALTCKINTNQSAMGRGNLKISITFMVARTALQAAGQGCKVTFAPTEGQVSKNLLSNPSLIFKFSVLQRMSHLPPENYNMSTLVTNTHTNIHVLLHWKWCEEVFQTTIWDRRAAQRPLLSLYLKFGTGKDQMKVIVLFVRRCAALKCLCPRSCIRCGILPLFFSHGEDLSPRCVNAFKFEWGVEVSTKLPGLC